MPPIDRNMLTHFARAIGALAIFLVALPILSPSLASHIALARPDGHCQGPDGIIVVSLSGEPLQGYQERCAVDRPGQPPYSVQPYAGRRSVIDSLTPEAGRHLLPDSYHWQSGPARMYADSPLTSAITIAIAPMLWLLALLAVLVVALRPR